MVIDKMPSEYKIAANLSLKDMMIGLNDKDMRRFAYSIFNKYPIEDYYSEDDVFADELPDYKLYDKSGLNVYAASVSGFVTTSLPIDGYKEDELRLEDNDGNYFNVHNYYGGNGHVIELYLPNEESAKTYIERLKGLIEGKIRVSEEFEIAYKESGEETQRLIYSAFESAHGARLLFPCKSDKKRMKKFDIDKNKSVYELRALAEAGFRVIVDVIDGELRVALFYTKAEANSKKGQKAMALRGWNIMRGM